jgi:hypothetical protein
MNQGSEGRINLKVIRCVVIGVLTLGIDVAHTNPGILGDAQQNAYIDSKTRVILGANTPQGRDNDVTLKRNKAMSKNQMTPEELLKQIRTLKESGLDVRGGIPEDGPEAEAYASLIYQRMLDKEGNIRGTIPEGSVAGT